MNILGLSSYYHDSTACIFKNGRLIYAIEEEKLSRIQHDKSYPRLAIRKVLEMAKLQIQDIDVVAYYEDPIKKASRKLWMVKQVGEATSRGQEILASINKDSIETDLKYISGYTGPIEYVEHHQAHAASSYYFSGFNDSAIMTVDGVGEWATTTYGNASEHHFELFEEVHFPHSLGLLYSTITSYLGFKVNSGEYKVMGLAPYGENKYLAEMEKLVRRTQNGQFELDMSYFDFLNGNQMYSSKLEDLFGEPARKAESKLSQFQFDIAKSLQQQLENTLLDMANYLHKKTNSKNLCMAGGVALNCVANGKILNKGPFNHLFVQPAAGDAGGALGAAALVHARLQNQGKLKPNEQCQPTKMKHAYLGHSATSSDICSLIQSTGINFTDFNNDEPRLLKTVAGKLKQGKVIGWFNGPAEFGPRALGARSILADPRCPDMKDRINALVKMREGFRPFAPAILYNEVKNHFDLDHPSPFMLETCQVISKLDLPAITHIDNSARVQTVEEQHNGRFARLLAEFNQQTGCPILLNTSFNVRGEPIVGSPDEALICFIRSRMDILVLQDYIIERHNLPASWEKIVNQIALRKITSNVSHKVYEML